MQPSSLLIAASLSLSVAIVPTLPVLAQNQQESVGTVRCGGVRGEYTNTRSIQSATIESTGQGYQLRFTELMQGQLSEVVWQLDRGLIIEEAMSECGRWNLTSYNRQAPVEIQLTGEFEIAMMVSSRSVCTFSGKLQFLGNTQGQLFPSEPQIGMPEQRF